MKTIKRISAAALAVAVGFGIAAPSASADEVEDFYKGKRLKMIVGSGAGGGTTSIHVSSRAISASTSPATRP